MTIAKQAKHANPPGVRTILHASPAVWVAGLLSAQRRGLSLREFLDDALAKACIAGSDGPESEPYSRHSMSLFVQFADSMPDQLTGPWRVLYSKVVADELLWEAPQQTVGEAADFLSVDGWRIDERKLSKAWPRLVAETFGI